MKVTLSVAASLLCLVLAGRCLALMSVEEVSKERAKELGVSFQSRTDLQGVVTVSMEFEIGGAFKSFSRVDLQMNGGDNTRLFATLHTDRPGPGKAVASFSVDRDHVGSSMLRIVTESGGERIGYDFWLKHFIEVEKPH